ncbi:MAG: nickel-dependent hydrogenase large subunit [Candidatus Omnitrophota bacterium]
MHKYHFDIDPVTRIEGHLGVEVFVDGGVVRDARCSGTLSRGFEIILKGRDPRDANRLTQRVCGVCPAIHSKSSAMCLDDAFGLTGTLTPNGRIIRNLILGSNFLQSHILHFYHLAALDYVDVSGSVGKIHPFMPRYEGDYRLPDGVNKVAVNHYVMALDMRRKSHEMLAIFGGKMPHNIGIVPGGVTEVATEEKITNFLWRLNEIREFIDNYYLPDVLTVAAAYQDYAKIGRGCGTLLAYGGFEGENDRLFSPGVVSADLQLNEFFARKITEEVRHSWYSAQTTGLAPSAGETVPDTEKKEAYSFIKSPRYEGRVCEVGPLARMAIQYLRNDDKVKSLVDKVISGLGLGIGDLFSVIGRHAARAIECKIVADAMTDWVMELAPGGPSLVPYDIPETAEGAGLTAAPRGACGHWISVREKKIARYQIITPTAWNASPKDDKGVPGPMEQALIGAPVKDKDNPFEVVRIIRSFDPCLACSVHMLTAKGSKIGEFRVV